MEPKGIDALVEQAIKHQLELGLAMQSVYGGQYASLTSISRFFHEHGDGNYSHTTMEQYRQMLKDRLDSGEIGRTHYISMIKATERVTEVYNTGRLKWSCRTRLSKFALNEEYEAALNGFLKSRQLRSNTRGDYIWVIRKYLAYLQQDGCTQLSQMTTEKLAEYIIYCTHSLKRGTLHDIMCYMRAFHKYLEDNGQVKISYMSILSIPVVRGTKIQRPLTSAELDAILQCVDRSTDKGKRNYALILLSALMRMRGGDIAKLRFRDIDWAKNELHIVQSKTKRTLLLPLLPEVRDAMKEYILSSRPDVASEYIFLRLKAPFKELGDSQPIYEMFKSYQKAAGIVRKSGDGKSFHGLRRRQGREMVVEGMPIATISQVLGHGKMDSAKQYISLDSVHLRDCALSFGGIGSGGEWYE